MLEAIIIDQKEPAIEKTSSENSNISNDEIIPNLHKVLERVKHFPNQKHQKKKIRNHYFL